MMAAPISHPEATAANDFSTVLPNQAGECFNHKRGAFVPRSFAELSGDYGRSCRDTVLPVF